MLTTFLFFNIRRNETKFTIVKLFYRALKIIITGIFLMACNNKTSPKPANVLKCEDLVSTKKDHSMGRLVTGSIKPLYAGERGQKELSIICQLSQKSVILNIHVPGIGKCIDKGKFAYIIFRDGTKTSLRNNLSNCYGIFRTDLKQQYVEGEDRKQLETKEIKTVRVETNTDIVEKDFTPVQSKEFIKTLSCLLNR